VAGWHAITQDGPQRLPPSDGGVRAFKFKGPDGHPFELIWFPKGQGREIWADHKSNALFLGIDHTAMSISSTDPSVAFYQSLGFSVEHQTLNAGPKQSMLDAIAKALVDVTSMRPASARGMGIELLRYHPHGRKLTGTRPQDLITDWITLADSPVERAVPVTLLKDPDGHRVILTAA
jgi:catechol 2,3-dioxygenase-like lactoylglutathione lyase family enzyme